MKEQADRPAKKRGRKKRAKEQAEANPVQPEHTVKIHLQMPRTYGAQYWADVEELWRGL